MADLGEVPFRRYYGSVNSTPLFVMLAGEYLDRTDDVETCRRLWPNIEAALGWIETYGDRDGDGLVEYGRRTVQGLAIRAGKTATMLFSTRTVCSPAVRSRSPKSRAMLFAAWRSAERIMRRLGQADRAAAYGAKAEALRARFDALFFDAEFGTYVLALDGDKKPCRVRASNAGHALFAGIALPERAGPVANVLMGSSSFCGWGIRTIASGEARYNPMSYHNGSVWPHDNALIAAGFARYGRREETARLFESLFAASTYVDCARLPELICGFPRQRSRGPTFYPVACSPQAWAAATPLYLLQSCLGPGRSRARPGPDRGSSDSPGLPAPPEETMRRSASPIGTAGAPTTRHNAWRRRMGRPRQEGFSSIEPEAEAKRAARGSLRKSTRRRPRISPAVGRSAAPSTPANPRKKGSNRSSTPSTPSVRPARRSFEASFLPQLHRRRAHACSARTPDCSSAEWPTSLGDAWTERWLRRTAQSETPVPPKAGFET